MMVTVMAESLSAWWPETLLSLGALTVMLVSAWTRHPAVTLSAVWATLLLAAAALWQAEVPAHGLVFHGLIAIDLLSQAFRWIALASVTITVLLVMASREFDLARRGESLGLFLLVGVGFMLMAEANHLLVAYLAVEMVSLGSYALVGHLHEPRSAEAGLKYLLFGALSSGIMLFGMSLLYGLAGTLGLPELLDAMAQLDAPPPALLLVAVVMVLAGLGFKISMVPFHLWTPDAYEGAPVPVAALLSVGSKAAGLALLLRIGQALAPLWPALHAVVIVLTVVTMTLGNFAALAQTNVKRLLAYSTIGQVGYVLIGIAAHTRFGAEALLVYVIAYLFMNLGAFACVVAVVNETGSESVDAFRGLARRAPGLALLCALFLLSLAGIPPLLGFFGKFLLLGAALDAGLTGLALAAVINSAVALYYYVLLIRQMYLAAAPDAPRLRPSAPLRLALGVCAAGTVLLGLFPSPLLELVRRVGAANLL